MPIRTFISPFGGTGKHCICTWSGPHTFTSTGSRRRLTTLSYARRTCPFVPNAASRSSPSIQSVRRDTTPPGGNAMRARASRC